MQAVRNEIAVVYLARKAEGIEPIRRFLASYRANDPGVPHDLIAVFKGYDSDRELAKARREFDTFTYRAIQVSDEGFDIGAYLHTANATRPGVGIVGATASYESLYDSLAFLGKSVWLSEIKGIAFDEAIARYFYFALKTHAPRWIMQSPLHNGRIHRW